MELEQLTSIPAGWAAIGSAVLIFAVVAAYAVFRKWGRQDAESRRRKENYNSYISALHEWQDAIEQGDAASAARIAEELDGMRKAGWNLPALVLCAGVLACALSSSCRSAQPPPPPPVPETVLLTEHVRIVRPGDTVPDLPEGEPFWWMATPKGMVHLLPSDSPATRIMETPQ